MPGDLPLTVKRNPRARRLILRLAARGGGVEVVAPRRASQREIERFVARHGEWIGLQRAARPPAVPFAPGAVIPFRGTPHRIALAQGLRGLVQARSGEIRVACLPEHLPRRVADWLKREAKAALEKALAGQMAALGRAVPPFTVRDTSSRWGSCSASGRLSFSWRLIMAPPDVLDYVVAHEAAHLVHMNHGPRFWRLCERLAPQSETARDWLRTHGPALHRYG